jgi:5-methylcytosine-specific restriction protein A
MHISCASSLPTPPHSRAVYGELGVGFAECHHRQPLASLPKPRKTTMSDLAILSANCHRMIHRTRPLMTVEAFARLLQERP